MTTVTKIDQKFGEIAIDLQLVSQEKIDRALIVQRCILKQTRVHMPIGKVLCEMGLLTQEQVNLVIETQRSLGEESGGNDDIGDDMMEEIHVAGFDLVISSDKLSASLVPTGEDVSGVTVQTVKMLLAKRKVTYGVISDRAIENYLAKKPLAPAPFKIAVGQAAKPGRPPEIKYHFDTNPTRIGTANEDGTMDWKNRGDIPQVKEGDLLAEKLGGDPGKPGVNVLGQTINPPRIREPQLKSSKGAQRSEDGLKIFAKAKGSPDLGPDKRISVLALLSIPTDIGVETGHISFDGVIEVDGGVCSGYKVKGEALRTKEIQNATVELSGDLTSFGGIYRSTLNVEGTIKASHLHNSEVKVQGDLEIVKEIIGSKVEVNGRCLMKEGKIIDSTVFAKKGIEVGDVGTEAATPSNLIVGVDQKYERQMKQNKESVAALGRQADELEEAEKKLKQELEQIGEDLGESAQEQDKYMVQRRQLEEKMNLSKNQKDKKMIAQLNQILEDIKKQSALVDKKVNDLMEMEDKKEGLLAEYESKRMSNLNEIEKIKEEEQILKETFQVDPGVPVVKVFGTIFSRTTVSGYHKKITIKDEARCVKIFEGKVEGATNKWEIKTSNI
ncbi:MAG: DUF342 domain-containing protein [Desulfobacteraceae bacterium]|nr:DUF342 domain-containing protein [Desulfobacteraceae bacterium]